jgi:hypothetical protein
MIVGGDTSTFGEESVGSRAGVSVKSQHLECNRENGDA